MTELHGLVSLEIVQEMKWVSRVLHSDQLGIPSSFCSVRLASIALASVGREYLVLATWWLFESAIISSHLQAKTYFYDLSLSLYSHILYSYLLRSTCKGGPLHGSLLCSLFHFRPTNLMETIRLRSQKIGQLQVYNWARLLISWNKPPWLSIKWLDPAWEKKVPTTTAARKKKRQGQSNVHKNGTGNGYYSSMRTYSTLRVDRKSELLSSERTTWDEDDDC
jgi:hypothetical protein